MSKGSGGKGTKGSGSVGGAGTNASQKADQKVDTKLLSRNGINGKAIQGLISGRGGISKSVISVSSNSGKVSKSNFKGLTKSQILSKSKSLNTIRIKISHAYRNDVSGGGPSVEITGGAEDVEYAKKAGATHVYATVKNIGKRGKVTTWFGQVKL